MLVRIIPELGLFALIMALGLAFIQALAPLAGVTLRRPLWMAFAEPMAWGQFAFLLVAYASLTASFLLDDFSVSYVANNSNSMLPWYYKLTAVWGGARRLGAAMEPDPQRLGLRRQPVLAQPAA
jgi:cytochrome c-type biogenesis protein CcmF